MKAIAAVSENWGIGKDNRLLFRISEDMKLFREVTTGGVVIMGRKTLDSFPGGKPLPKRVNIVLTRDTSFERGDAIIVNSPGAAAAEAEKFGREIFVIGGAEIYALFLDRCDECLITKVAAAPDADAFFPNLDERADWCVADEGKRREENGIGFKFVKYKKIKEATL